MSENIRIRSAIYSALEELNQMSPPDQHIPAEEDAKLAGVGGRLDSLGLVNLIVLVEQKLEEQMCASISLMDGDLADGNISRFESVGSLTAYVTSLIEQRPDV